MVTLPNKSLLRILVYHRINDALPPGEWVVGLERFRQQMTYLKTRCAVIGLEELLPPPCRGETSWSSSSPAARRPRVLLTFDDGYRDNYLNAYPVLKEFGFPAVIFLTTGMVGTDQKRPRYQHMPSPDMLDWEEVGVMARGDIAFGAHTESHPHLSSLSCRGQRADIEGSLRAIECHVALGRPQPVFCYPYGDYNPDTLFILKELGVSLAFAMETGFNGEETDPLRMKRILIAGEDDLVDFKRKLSGDV